MGPSASDSTVETLPPAIRDGLIRQIESGSLELPVLPDAANQVITESFNEDCDIGRLADIIGRDPFMTGHVLRVSNSALYSPLQPIESLQQALCHLGLTKIREIAILVSCESRVFKVPGFEDQVQALFQHSVAAGTCAQNIATLRQWNVEEAFLGGLLHDIGKPVLLQAINDIKVRVGIKLRKKINVPHEAVLELADEFHSQVGSQLMESWKLTPRLAEAIRYHHDPASAPKARQEAAMLQLADDVAHVALQTRSLAPEDLQHHAEGESAIVQPNELEGLLDCREQIAAISVSLNL